jgi:superfamily II DNA or RNA helicase
LPKQHHQFRDKLILNQWLISQFGIDPLADYSVDDQKVRPFRKLTETIRDPQFEGLDHDNLHHFYNVLVNSALFWNNTAAVSKEQLLLYELNISSHTQAINEKRDKPVVWKYFQWLNLLFVEYYLDRYFSDPEKLVNELNLYVDKFNRHYSTYLDIPNYTEDDLNKLCMQNATGSGKTLLMHVNILQYRHYAQQYGRLNELTRIILLTPNERLSEQHINEFRESSISATLRIDPASSGFGLGHVDVTEITKFADQQGPNTIETRSLGDRNLLLVDEGHRGMSSKEEGVWFSRRAELCAKGFTFEYSATFEQAFSSGSSEDFKTSYAKTVIFDYSYRWFYEDGFGKDYQILNIPKTLDETETVYLTACLLKYYQQLQIYEENLELFRPFNIEKPLWVFVGTTVSKAKGTKDEEIVATDVAKIILFIADFLEDRQSACWRIGKILKGRGQDTGLIDANGNDIFNKAFVYLLKKLTKGITTEQLYSDITKRLFQNPAGGSLVLERLKGESGEIALRAGGAESPFGLINVGDAKGLCDHIAETALAHNSKLDVQDSDFTEAMFASVKDSGSPVNLLIGSKKFIEGWDCWRVSTMGLMHVGKSEGTQIIQLFGRGVRLKGYNWSLKRSGYTNQTNRPPFIEELETLNVFGIQADFIEKFRDFLKDEGLPGNERREIFEIPLNITYDFGKKLKALQPKVKATDGREYDFKKDGAVPTIGIIPEYLKQNRVVIDWYPQIQALQSRDNSLSVKKDIVHLQERHLDFIKYDSLYFELEQFKRERSWHNLNISIDGIKTVLKDNSWYILYFPEARLNPSDFQGINILQQLVGSLLKQYCDRYYNYCKRQFTEPRLELREMDSDYGPIPEEDSYSLIVDGDETQLIEDIKRLKQELAAGVNDFIEVRDIIAIDFGIHLFQPLLHIKKSGVIKVQPVSLNESEYQFVCDLRDWVKKKTDDLQDKEIELYLLRNMSRGKGIGFFEAGNFHPDFILWVVTPDKQFVSFIEPHGLMYEGIGSEKIQFHERIKDVEKRLNDPTVVLNSFILSWTKHPQLKWGSTSPELEKKHVLFMTDDKDRYIEKMFDSISLDN